MKHVSYKTNSVCSRNIQFDISEQNTIHNVIFEGGCNGNLQAVSRLVEGKKAQEIVDILKGTICGYKSTSCADQLSTALLQAIEENS